MVAQCEGDHLSIIVCRHVDRDESTTTCRLLLELSSLSLLEHAKLEQESKQMSRVGKGFFAHTFLMDCYRMEERQRRARTDYTTNIFHTEKFCYTVIDSPGHRDFMKTIITGASQADVGAVTSSKRGSRTQSSQSFAHRYIGKVSQDAPFPVDEIAKAQLEKAGGVDESMLRKARRCYKKYGRGCFCLFYESPEDVEDLKPSNAIMLLLGGGSECIYKNTLFYIHEDHKLWSEVHSAVRAKIRHYDPQTEVILRFCAIYVKGGDDIYDHPITLSWSSRFCDWVGSHSSQKSFQRNFPCMFHSVSSHRAADDPCSNELAFKSQFERDVAWYALESSLRGMGAKAFAENENAIKDCAIKAVKNCAINFRSTNAACAKCASCNSLKACTGCNCVFYCSKECQMVDWKLGHRHHCQNLQKQFDEEVEKTAFFSMHEFRF